MREFFKHRTWITTSFPESLERERRDSRPGGGKMRDSGNEISWIVENTFLIFPLAPLARVFVSSFCYVESSVPYYTLFIADASTNHT